MTARETGKSLFVALAFVACSSSPRYRPEFARGADAAMRAPGPVLFVLTSASEQPLSDGSTRATGAFLNEVYEPYRALRAAGHTVVVATPEGRRPSVDPESLDDKYWDEHSQHRDSAQQLFEAEATLTEPLTLDQALAHIEEYQGVLIPGGQGVMVDLLDDERVHHLLSRFAESHRPVGLVCHAPAVLARMREPGSLRGRRLTSVSSFEEFYIETFVMGAEPRFRDIGEALEERGFRHEAAFPGSAHAVRDCNLVTSQNPFSGGAFNAAYLAALRDFRRGARCVSTTDEDPSPTFRAASCSSRAPHPLFEQPAAPKTHASMKHP